MKSPTPLLLVLCALSSAWLTSDASAEVRRYLYCSTPDGAQVEGKSGTGIVIFDIDNGHKFVRRIDIPIFMEGLRGFTGCTETKSLYYSTTNRRLGCFDLESEKVVWDKQYDRGCDRSCITPDGKRIYAPSGWWYLADDSGMIVIDPKDGTLLETIPVNTAAHNSIASLDGKYVYLGTTTTLTQFDAGTGKALQTISPVGEVGVFPFTVTSDNSKAYVCLGKHVGVDVVDLKEGKVLHRVFAINPDTKEKIEHRTHGAGMTPDETQLWISDQEGKRLYTFDMTVSPPVQTGHLDLSMGGHGWVCFSLDGTYGYSHTPDVFDVKSRKKVATLKDEHGKPFGSSKFIEVHMDEGKVVKVSNEFGLGRVHAGK
ncbi:MAG: PQQ-binding-like beta-propeller repeat protein [Verrucomicrobiales bacterium]